VAILSASGETLVKSAAAATSSGDILFKSMLCLALTCLKKADRRLILLGPVGVSSERTEPQVERTYFVLHPAIKHWYPSGCMCVSLLCLAQEEGSPKRAPHRLHACGLAPVLQVTITSRTRRRGASRYSLNVAMGLQARELSESLAAIDADMWPVGGGEQ